MAEKGRGLVGGLNDNCFMFASESLTELCELIEDESGEKPTINELCEVLLLSLKCCKDDILNDVNVRNVTKLTPKVSKSKKVSVNPGDVFAIPRDKGGFYFVIYITTNCFEQAFGIFEGHSPIPYISEQWDPTPITHPIYSGKIHMTEGTWKRVAQREDLLELFPANPEIFHEKEGNEEEDEIGSYGCGESPTGEIRNLTKSEATKLGLLKRTYRQFMDEIELEKYLQKTLG